MTCLKNTKVIWIITVISAIIISVVCHMNSNSPKVLKDTENFYLEEKSMNEYYCEVYDNEGEVLFFETFDKCPEFVCLDEALYELKVGYGIFAWQSIYFNVENGYKSERFVNSFYLTNGVIAYVNHVATFTDDGGTETGKLTFITLFDLYDRVCHDILDAEFLKPSLSSYLIEYVDDTHISVSYYTENGQTENIKILEILSLTTDSTPLNS